MFTFGRNHEKDHVIKFIGDEEKARSLILIIDLIHDRIDGRDNDKELFAALHSCIKDGESAVWESAGMWLIKLTKEEHSFNDIWEELTTHRHAKVRFRVASFLDDIPYSVATSIYEQLVNDKSIKVREQAIGKWDLRRRTKKTDT